MENNIKQRKIERTQFYWVCPKCEQEIKGNGEKTVEHLQNLHIKMYCKGVEEEEN